MAIYSILDSQVVIIAFKFVFLDLYIERSKFFFSGLRPGLTNRVPVRDSVSRTPLGRLIYKHSTVVVSALSIIDDSCRAIYFIDGSLIVALSLCIIAVEL